MTRTVGVVTATQTGKSSLPFRDSLISLYTFSSATDDEESNGSRRSHKKTFSAFRRTQSAFAGNVRIVSTTVRMSVCLSTDCVIDDALLATIAWLKALTGVHIPWWLVLHVSPPPSPGRATTYSQSSRPHPQRSPFVDWSELISD